MLVYLICYGAGMLFASSAHYCMSGISLILAALYLYFYDYRKSGNPLHLRGLFSAFWVGGQGLSCMKLSRLQTDWDFVTWACFFVALTAFWTVYELAERRFAKKESEPAATGAAAPAGKESGYSLGLFTAIILLTLVSLAAFILEAVVLGYVPFFVRGVPHAYSYFHISGVHYFTVSCVLVPSMTAVLFVTEKKLSMGKKIVALIATLVALSIPILCVSRFQLIFAVILAVLTFMQVSGIKKIRYLFMAAAALVPLYIILSIARSHDVEYLNGIFEMKNLNTPIFITQPYMYIANNYDNFNCLVEQLPAHTYGIKGLFPLWALTGLKFLKPELVSFPLYTTKEELTTVTLFYDAYYDFGIAGVFFFAAVLGLFSAWLMRRASRRGNPFWQVFYGQAALYFMLSFFTTWYSNPTTWFYFAATGAAAVYVEIIKRAQIKSSKNHLTDVK
ncbi:MAG: oligosaccharide repeat unit polymerase [Lachnospiraceae bacterium]|nr:oligosaccharide repeat unit polymerase [Lachnospiraceae bacterium]